MGQIGFCTGIDENKIAESETAVVSKAVGETPVRSVVTVRFEGGREYSYYNDEFNLKVGDVVFVEGKLADQHGRVIDLTTKFKVSLDYYKRVTSKLNLNFTVILSKKEVLW